MDFLTESPDSKLLVIDDVSISLNHGSPFDQDYYLYPDTDAGYLNACENSCDFVFVGHSHYPFVHKLASGLLINVGSVGQSRNKGGVASWCVLNTVNKTIEMRSTLYDISILQKEVLQSDPDIPYLFEILKRNKV